MKHVIFLSICINFLYAIHNLVCAQTKIQTINNNGWYMFFGNHQLKNKWKLHTEYQWRRNKWIKYWQQSLTRVGIDYQINEQTTVTLGYAHIITYPYGEQPVLRAFNENRIWQNLSLSNKNGIVYILHRFRLEQRFSDKYKLNQNNEIIFDRIIYTNRFRYMISVSIPLNKNTIEKSSFFIRFYEEMFVNFGKNVDKNIFDQNRLYLALGYQISSSANLQLGYMNQLLFKSDGTHYENNNNLQLAITYNLDFSKTK